MVMGSLRGIPLDQVADILCPIRRRDQRLLTSDAEWTRGTSLASIKLLLMELVVTLRVGLVRLLDAIRLGIQVVQGLTTLTERCARVLIIVLIL